MVSVPPRNRFDVSIIQTFHAAQTPYMLITAAVLSGRAGDDEGGIYTAPTAPIPGGVGLVTTFFSIPSTCHSLSLRLHLGRTSPRPIFAINKENPVWTVIPKTFPQNVNGRLRI
jgi:hypothetical protein